MANAPAWSVVSPLPRQIFEPARPGPHLDRTPRPPVEGRVVSSAFGRGTDKEACWGDASPQVVAPRRGRRWRVDWREGLHRSPSPSTRSAHRCPHLHHLRLDPPPLPRSAPTLPRSATAAPICTTFASLSLRLPPPPQSPPTMYIRWI